METKNSIICIVAGLVLHFIPNFLGGGILLDGLSVLGDILFLIGLVYLIGSFFRKKKQ